MTDSTAIPSTPDQPKKGAPSYDPMSFDTTTWQETPAFVIAEESDTALFTHKEGNDGRYRSTKTPTQWNRYINLGYYALDNGDEFDAAWENFAANPRHVHHIVWYNYQDHMDRDMQVPPKLHHWATTVSKSHLIEHGDDEFLDIDTLTISRGGPNGCRSIPLARSGEERQVHH